MKYRKTTWEQINKLCSSIIKKIDKDNFIPNCIVGISRGGLIPARILADYYDITDKFYVIEASSYFGINIRIKVPVIKKFDYNLLKGQDVLLVDDIWDSGSTMKAIIKKSKMFNIKTSTLFWKETANEQPDYFGDISSEKEWVVFAWENHEFNRQKGRTQ